MGKKKFNEIDNDFNEYDNTTPRYSEEDVEEIINKKLMKMMDKKKNDIIEDDEVVIEENVPFQIEDGSYFITDNRSLHKFFNYIEENHNGLKKFTYVYMLTADRNPYIQVSNYNGTHKNLSRQNFLDDICINYENETGEKLKLRTKAQMVDKNTGEYMIEEKGEKRIAITISEVSLVLNLLKKVHDLDYDPERPHSSVYENEENGRLVYNKFCAPKKLREFHEKAKDLPKIDKITLERAREKGYLVCYAFFHNLLNPAHEDNIGKVKFGKDDDDTLSVFFNRQAFILQTLRKTNTYMLFSSDQGVGKNTYYKHFIQYILGKEKAYLSSGDALNEQYNGYMAGKLYIAFDEAKVNAKDNAEAVATRMKKFTNEDIEMREMRADRYNVAASFNLDIFTNEDILMKLDFSDRRCITIKSGENLADKITQMGFETFTEFSQVFRSQVDAFIIDLLCLNYNENMAVNGVIYNEYRKRIIRKTNKRITILMELIKGRKLNDLAAFFQDTPEEDKSKLEDLILHVKYNFLTADDTNFMLKEILEDFHDKSNNFSKSKFWNDNIGEAKPVNYTTEEGNTTSMSIRKLNNFKNKDLQTVMNLYSKATQSARIELRMKDGSFDSEDILIDKEDEFSPDNLIENKVKSKDLYELLSSGEF